MDGDSVCKGRVQCLCLIGFAVRIGLWIDAVESLFPSRIPVRLPVGVLRLLPNLCTIIERAMYTEINPETIIQMFLVHGHPIADYFMIFAISCNLDEIQKD